MRYLGKKQIDLLRHAKYTQPDCAFSLQSHHHTRADKRLQDYSKESESHLHKTNKAVRIMGLNLKFPHAMILILNLTKPQNVL